jgi:hypothetical protein
VTDKPDEQAVHWPVVLLQKKKLNDDMPNMNYLFLAMSSFFLESNTPWVHELAALCQIGL